jgi:acylphosphatase
MRSLKITITGTVQGVGFRHFTKTTADRLGVKGWVRNLYDGRVELLAQFPDDQTEERFLSLLSEGPSHSTVSKIEKEIEDFHPQFERFEIRF